jgi:hypothetical protein
MTRIDIITELEAEYEREVDPNFDAGVNELCDGEACRHGSECDCHNSFVAAVREHLETVEDSDLVFSVDYRQKIANAAIVLVLSGFFAGLVFGALLFEAEEISRFMREVL